MAVPPVLRSGFPVQSASWGVQVGTTAVTASGTVVSGDFLVVRSAMEDQSTATITNSGTAQTWTLRQQVAVANTCRESWWTATASVGQAMTVTITSSVSGKAQGVAFWAFSSHGGIGVSNKANGTTGAPSVSLASLSANSWVGFGNADFLASAHATRTYLTNAGTAVELEYAQTDANYSQECATHADSGSAGTKTIGMSAPSSGMTWSCAALEVLGTAGAAANATLTMAPFRGAY